MGWHRGNSQTNYVFNHIGNFAVAGETICRTLFMDGVPKRFPSLQFAFLEGGVGWGCNLYSDILSHYEKRNRESVQNYNPAHLDRKLIREKFERYASTEELAHIDDLSLPHTEYAIAAYYIIATAEASANLARFDGVRYGFRAAEARDPIDMYRRTRAGGFGAEVKRRIILGTYVLSSGYYDAYYLSAQKVRTLIRRDFEQAFDKCQALLTPVAPTTAYRLGEKTDDPLQMYLGDIFTVTANLAGICGLSVPCGTSAEGLPVGLQILGPALGEENVLRVGLAYENAVRETTDRD